MKKKIQFIRILLLFLGTLFVGLAIIGAILPLIPTTPFLLLAAACYSRSSDRFYHWLIFNKWFGTYLRDYREKKGIPLKVKIMTIGMMWFFILISTLFFVQIIWVKILLIMIAIAGTIHITLIRTKR